MVAAARLAARRVRAAHVAVVATRRSAVIGVVALHVAAREAADVALGTVVTRAVFALAERVATIVAARGEQHGETDEEQDRRASTHAA